jgi:hypothetical protein
MYCTSKQTDVFVSALWSLIKYEYNLPIHNLIRKGKTPQKGKIQENFRLGTGTQTSKILEEIPPGEEEYPGKILPANRNTN